MEKLKEKDEEYKDIIDMYNKRFRDLIAKYDENYGLAILSIKF